jgi:hypothetical protein
MRQSARHSSTADRTIKEPAMRMRTLMGIVGATGVAVALPLLAAESLAVKLGLWENSATMNMSIPPAALASMPAAQRTQMEAVMKQMGSQTLTDRSCMTEKDLDGRSFRDALQQPGMQCEQKMVTATSKRQEITMQCTSPGGPMTGRVVVDVVNDGQVRGTMEMRSAQVNIDATFESKFLSADCGDVKPN